MRGAVALALALATNGAGASSPRVEEARAAMESGDVARAARSFRARALGQPARGGDGRTTFAVMADDDLDFPAALAGYRTFLRRDRAHASRPARRPASTTSPRTARGLSSQLQRLERVRRDEQLANRSRHPGARPGARDPSLPGPCARRPGCWWARRT